MDLCYFVASLHDALLGWFDDGVLVDFWWPQATFGSGPLRLWKALGFIFKLFDFILDALGI